MTDKPKTYNGDLANLPPALAPLCQIDHWVVWRWELKNGKWTKPPYMAANPGRHAANNDPATWASYQAAATTAQNGKVNGIGFALPGTPFDVVDLDHCVDPGTGKVDPWAQTWLNAANGSYVERTPSGEGLRIIGFAPPFPVSQKFSVSQNGKNEGNGKKPGAMRKLHRKWEVTDAGAREGAAIEVYRSCERYITVTGLQVGACATLGQTDDLLEKIAATYDAKKSGGGFDYNKTGRQNSSIDYEDVIQNGAPAGSDVSAVFHSVVGHLHAKGMSVDEIVDELSKWVNGIGQRYAGRLRGEIERSFEKWQRKRRIEAPASEPDEEANWEAVDKNGIPRPTCANARRAIRALGIECRYDVFHDKLLVASEAIRRRSNLDQTVLILRTKIHKAWRFDPGTKNTIDAVVQLCLENEFDPVLDYLDALKWDRMPRLERWLTTYLGAADTELNREFGRLALLAAVRRVRRPGTKFDPIIVLEGPMGTMKSMAIETMAGTENFSDQTILGARDREQQELLAGVWLYEIAELSNIRKTEVEHLRAFASRTHDRARPAYGRTRIDQPRRCVLFATTNDDRYLKAPDRRFWPVKTTTIDIAALRRGRDQLWAEAAAREPGASIGLRRELWDAAGAEQAEREEADPWDDILSQVTGTVEQGEERISSIDLLSIVLGIHQSKQYDRDYKRLGRCMRRLKWDGPKKMKIGDKETKGYSRGNR